MNRFLIIDFDIMELNKNGFRVDISNVIRFFREKGSPVIGMRTLFEFIVDPCIDEKKAEEILEKR